MRKVLIIDTSILCVWLQVAGMEACRVSSCLHADKIDLVLQPCSLYCAAQLIRRLHVNAVLYKGIRRVLACLADYAADTHAQIGADSRRSVVKIFNG